ncbi:MAG: GAF domain-containing protein [Desulfotalea sp.]
MQERIGILEKKSEQNKRFEKINSTLFKISNTINSTSSLEELYEKIHIGLSSIIDTTNFYIASYDKIKDSITFPYVVDTVNVNYPSVIENCQTASLTAEVIKSGAPIMITKSDILAKLYKHELQNPKCTTAEIWLGVPLTHLGEIIGVMAVQNYDNFLCYDQMDKRVMIAVADR